MNKHHQIEITVYDRQHGYKNETYKNVKWLRTVLPVLMKIQKAVTEQVFLDVTNEVTSFYMN
jgi:hypothetical protein